MRRRLIFAGIGLLIVVIAAVVVVAVVYPSVAATTCPRCYGMTRLRARLYAEDESRTPAMTTLFEDANRRVSAFYGGRETAPTIVACFTDGCYRKIGGGRERGVAVLGRAVMLSPRGLDPVIAAHEMSHVELRHRLRADVPQWFNEGLAVVVSDDSRYLLPVGSADRCRVEPNGELPVTLPAWLRVAGADEQTYAKAACRTTRVLDRMPLLELIDRLNAGASFAELTAQR